jgi:hypothetical protein
MGHSDELVTDVTSNECPADLGRGNWLEKGRNNELAKDAIDILISKGGSLAVGEYWLRLILRILAGEGLQGRAGGGGWGVSLAVALGEVYFRLILRISAGQGCSSFLLR